MRTYALLLAACSLCAPYAYAAEPAYTLKSADNAPPNALKKAVRELLEAKSAQVLDGNGKLVAEVWFRKSVPGKAEEEQIKNGLTYRELEMTAIVGAIQFHQPGKDYKGHDVKEGVYTLRVAVQPQDGDHMGTAPYAEFCLLCSAEKDEKPDAMEPKSLVELSAKSMDSSHPGVLLLFPNPKPEANPKLSDKGMGHWVLLRKLDVDVKGKPASIGVGLTVIGKSAQAGQ